MTTKRRRWCRGKINYATTELAERSRRGIVYRDAVRGHLKPGMRLAIYWCDVCQAFHLGHERADVPPEIQAAPPVLKTPEGPKITSGGFE